MQENDPNQQSSQPSTTSQAANFGSTALNESKAAATHAWSALKTLFADPISGQGEAFEALGGPKALRAGLVMLLAFAVSSYLMFSSLVSAVQQLAAALMGFPGELPGLMGSQFDIKLVLFCVVPAAAVFLSYLLIAFTMTARKNDYAACIYSAGITVLPLAAWFLFVWLLGLGSPLLLTLVSLFCLSTTFIFITSVLRDIFRLDSRKTLLLTPAVIIVSAYASKLLYDILM